MCPEGIHITDNALIPMKERVVDRKYDPLVWLGSKIGRRDALPETPPAAPAPARPREPAPAAQPAATAAAPTNAMNISEFTSEIQGALSPFGEGPEYPVPTESLRYHHPRPEDRPNL